MAKRKLARSKKRSAKRRNPDKAHLAKLKAELRVYRQKVKPLLRQIEALEKQIDKETTKLERSKEPHRLFKDAGFQRNPDGDDLEDDFFEKNPPRRAHSYDRALAEGPWFVIRRNGVFKPYSIQWAVMATDEIIEDHFSSQKKAKEWLLARGLLRTNDY